jgi:hypothetical protein
MRAAIGLQAGRGYVYVTDFMRGLAVSICLVTPSVLE